MEWIVLVIVLFVFAALGGIAKVWSTQTAILLLVILIMGVVAYSRDGHPNSFTFICPAGAVAAFITANRVTVRWPTRKHEERTVR